MFGHIGIGLLLLFSFAVLAGATLALFYGEYQARKRKERIDIIFKEFKDKHDEDV